MTGVFLRLSSDMMGTDKNNFLHDLFLTNRQAMGLPKAFVNGSSKGIKLSKTQISKIIQLGSFLGRLLGPLMKVRLPLMKNALTLLA